MQEKNAKSPGVDPEKSYSQSKIEFSLLRTDTIQLWALLEDFQPLDEHSLKSLSEDISYRIRETTDVNHSLFFLFFLFITARYVHP
jgi:hypothetical protein